MAGRAEPRARTPDGAAPLTHQTLTGHLQCGDIETGTRKRWRRQNLYPKEGQRFGEERELWFVTREGSSGNIYHKSSLDAYNMFIFKSEKTLVNKNAFFKQCTSSQSS